MKLEKFEYTTKGIIIDGKKYGVNITKIEIDGLSINIYIGRLDFDIDSVKEMPEFQDMSNPLELNKYENVRIIEDAKVVIKDEINS